MSQHHRLIPPIQAASLSLFAGLMILAGAGCKREPEVDPNDPVPMIVSVDISPGTVREFQDSIVFAVSYQDGDGDLGENTPNAENLWVKDNRIGITEVYRISQLAPSGSTIPIKGVLNVTLPSTGISDGSSSQQASFTIHMRDRAGNESNHFITDLITITR